MGGGGAAGVIYAGQSPRIPGESAALASPCGESLEMIRNGCEGSRRGQFLWWGLVASLAFKRGSRETERLQSDLCMGPESGKGALPGSMAERRQYVLSFGLCGYGKVVQGACSLDFSRRVRNQMYVKSGFQILATLQSLKVCGLI